MTGWRGLGWLVICAVFLVRLLHTFHFVQFIIKTLIWNFHEPVHGSLGYNFINLEMQSIFILKFFFYKKTLSFKCIFIGCQLYFLSPLVKMCTSSKLFLIWSIWNILLRSIDYFKIYSFSNINRQTEIIIPYKFWIEWKWYGQPFCNCDN